jgi:nitrite reductase/ring-hydroxylating ferredoxin subunit
VSCDPVGGGPAGWRRLDLPLPAPGQVVTSAEEGIALWADNSGRVCIAPDRCPHLSMPYAWDGLVFEGSLLCTSHGWRVDPSGEVFKRSMTGRRDSKGRLRLPELRIEDGSAWVPSHFDPASQPFTTGDD